VKAALDSGELAVLVARRDCLLAAGKIKAYERAIQSDGSLEKCRE
jgi:hypothetical protein